jgi:glycyl-tRNA synthetase alpha subunit
MEVIQKSLFSHYKDEVLNESPNFRIRHEYNYDVDIEFRPTNGQEIEEAALKTLGYFIVTE